MTWRYKLGVSGPINRVHYFIIFCVYVVVYFGAVLLLVTQSPNMIASDSTEEFPWVPILLILFLLFFFIEATGNRLLDSGHKSSLKWLFLVPFVGLILVMYLFFKPTKLAEIKQLHTDSQSYTRELLEDIE